MILSKNGGVVTHFEGRSQSSLSQALKKNAVKIAAKEQLQKAETQKSLDAIDALEPEYTLRVVCPRPRNQASALSFAKKTEVVQEFSPRTIRHNKI